MSVKRVFLIVLDSYGIGSLPDAGKFGDEGANTLASIVKSSKYSTPNMEKMGLFNIDGVTCREGVQQPIGSYGRMREASMGKDTTIGHWEIAGVVSPKPMPVYPEGFPEEVLKPFREQTGRGVLCNKPYSGTEVIRDYGEDRFAKNIAKHIVRAREKKPIETTGELCEIIKAAIPAKMRAGTGHPAKQTFQALRIELNHELDVLTQSIDGMIDRLAPGGRLCIITFHSLEDRIVKTRFRTNENPCICPPGFPVCVCGRISKGKVITRKPIIPSEQEMEENSRSKSAKLRVFEKA